MAAKRGVVGSTPNAWTGARAQPSQPQEGFHKLVPTLIDEHVSASTVNGSTFIGLLVNHKNAPEPSFTLIQATTAADPAKVIPTVTIPIKDLTTIKSVPKPVKPQPNPNSKSQSRQGFRTDVEVTGQGFKREKVLQAWGGPGDNEGGLEDDKQTTQRQAASPATGNGQWDQFATNERLFGLKTDYDEEIYTTKLDRSGADYRQREARAAQLEREILKGTGGLGTNAHMAEERGEVVDDSGMDEEDRYGAVIRGSGAYVPPGARKAAAASASRQQTPTNGSAPSATTPSPAPAPAPTATPAAVPSASTTPTPANAAASAAARQADPAILSTSRVPAFINKGGANAAAAAAAAGLPAIKREPPALHATFSQFVTTEKERLQQKRQAAVNNAVKKEHDSKLASLLKFSQEFKLPTPVPEDISNLLGKKTPAASAANTPAVSPNPPTKALPAAAAPAPAASVAPAASPAPATAKPAPKVSLPKPAGPPRLSGLASIGIAEIPPFNPNKNKSPSPVPAAAPAAAAPATSAAAPSATSPALAPKASTSKFNAAAPAFVFKPNPAAASFTPTFGGAPTPARKPSDAGSAASSAVPIKPPTSSPAAQPSAFFTKPVKKGSPSMRVKEDFTPFKNTHMPEPAQVPPTWASFTGKSYRAMWPPVHGPPEEDPSLAGGVPHMPPGPPGGYNPYQQYQPPNFPQAGQQPRFPQPGPPQGQPQPIPPHMAGPPINGGFQHFQGMAFPQPGVPPHGQPMFNPQQMAAGQAGVAPPGQFMRYPQFPPGPGQPGQQGAVLMGYEEAGLRKT